MRAVGNPGGTPQAGSSSRSPSASPWRGIEAGCNGTTCTRGISRQIGPRANGSRSRRSMAFCGSFSRAPRGRPCRRASWRGAARSGRPAPGSGLCGSPADSAEPILASRVFARYPDFFLPHYATIADKYHNLRANPGLDKLIRDNGATVRHLGYCVGFLLFEAMRRDWKNVTLISTVGILNGLGWSFLQNWKWAARFWPEAKFNFGRCWEVCGGISIGIGLGVAYYLVNRQETADRRAARERRLCSTFPHGRLAARCRALGPVGLDGVLARRRRFKTSLTNRFQSRSIVGSNLLLCRRGVRLRRICASFAFAEDARRRSESVRGTVTRIVDGTGSDAGAGLVHSQRSESPVSATECEMHRSGRIGYVVSTSRRLNEAARTTLHRVSALGQRGQPLFLPCCGLLPRLLLATHPAERHERSDSAYGIFEQRGRCRDSVWTGWSLTSASL